jgi:Phage terminase large subunit (GpA)
MNRFTDRIKSTAHNPLNRHIEQYAFPEFQTEPVTGPRATEGDVLLLAKVRTSTFGAQAKIVYSSSPVELESCRVSALFEDSRQEYWYSRCPRGHYQILGLAEMNFETGCCRCLSCGLEYYSLLYTGGS